MSNILIVMYQIWKMENIDWLGYESEERFSFHHINKKCNGGKKVINNGAILHLSSHSYLHTIEYYDLDKYIYLNKILKDINNQRYMPTREQLEQIKYVLIEFQNEYQGKVSSRDKPIIKKEYIIKKELR